MSEILIRGMEIPKDRPLIIKISPDGTVYMSQGIYGIGHGVATAVPIPPHGRLIDADELIREHRADNYDYAIYATYLVQNAPSVIPASE